MGGVVGHLRHYEREWALEKCESHMQKQRVIRRRRTNGISLTADEKFNLVTSYGTIKERAETERVHPATDW